MEDKKKQEETLKMSQQRDNKENATSRPSSRESEKTVSSASSTTSLISETASKIVSEILDLAAANIGELMQSISRWETEADDSEDNSSAACCTHQKLERQLQRFFSLRRVFAESQGETPEVTEEDLVTEMDPTPGPSGQEEHHVPNTVNTQKSCDSNWTGEKSEHRHGSKIYKKIKSAWKGCFRWKPRKEVQLAEEHDLDETAGSEGSDSKSSSPCPEETSPTPSFGSSEDIRATEKADMDVTDGSSLVLPGAEDVHIDEVTGSVSSDLTSSSVSPKEMSNTASIGSSKNIVAAEKADLLVTDMDSTHGPSLVLPGAEDDCKTILTVSRQKFCDSDRTDEQHAGRHGSKVYKKMKSAWKSCFRREPKRKVQQETEHDLDETVKSEGSDSKSGSPCAEETSPIASMHSSEDISYAMKADLSSDPLELADNVEHKDITPETEKGPSTLSPTGSSQPVEHCEVRSAVMEAYLVTNMDSQPGPSGQDGHLEPPQVHLGDEQNVDDIEAASNDLTSDCASPTQMFSTASIGSIEDIKAAEKADLSSVPLEDVTPEGVMEDNIDASPGPSPDVRAAIQADLSSAAVELVDVEDKEVTPEEKEDAVSKPSTTSSSPPPEHLGERSSVTNKDLAMYRDSTPGPSGQDRNLEGSQDDSGASAVAQITGLKNSFYKIIKEFFESLTEEQRREISKEVYNLDVKERLADMCVEVLKLIIEMITDVLSQAIYESARPYSTLTMKSPTSSQVCGTEVVGQTLLSELLREEDNISQSLKGSLGKAFCDVVGANTSISVSPKFTEAIVRAITNEVNSVLSQTVQVSLDGGTSNVHAVTCCQFSNCRTCKEILSRVSWAMNTFLTDVPRAAMKKTNRIIKVHKKMSPWWSCFHRGRQNKVHPISVDEALKLSSSKLSPGHKDSSSPRAASCSVRSSELNSTPVDYAEGEDATSEETGNTPSSYSIGWFPPACLEDEVPDYRESPLMSETRETEMRSSSCHQSGDSANRNCQTDVEEVVMAASGTDVNKIQAEKSSRLCRIFRKGKTKEDKASTQDQAVRTKKPSLLKRIRLFCNRLSCCSHNDGT